MSGASGGMTATATWSANDGTWSDGGNFNEKVTLATGGKAATGVVVIALSATTTIDIQALASTAFGKTMATSFDYITGISLMNTGTIEFSLDCSAAANPWVEAWDSNMDWLLKAGDVIQFACDLPAATDGYDVNAPSPKIHFVNAIATNGELTYVFMGY